MGSNLPIEEIREALGQALRAGKKRIVIEAPTVVILSPPPIPNKTSSTRLP